MGNPYDLANLLWPDAVLGRQPQVAPRLNPGHPLGKQRWACINIPGIALYGSANPSATLLANTGYALGKGGRSLLQTGTAQNSGLSYGANTGMRIGISSGVIVCRAVSSSLLPLFTTSFTTYVGGPGGFLIALQNNQAKLIKHDVVEMLASSNSCPTGQMAAIAWSYNGTTGRARIALNGVLSSGSSAQTFTHSTCNNGGYYTDNGGGTNPTEIALFALSPDECFSDSALIAASVNPWEMFEPISLGDWSPGLLSGGSALAGSATGSATAGGTANLAAQVALAGVGVATAGGSAVGSVAVPLSAAGISVAGGSAATTATVSISAAGLAQAAGTAGLSASVLLAGAGAAQASGNATLAAQLSAMASGAAQAGGSANLSGGAQGAISASGGAVSGGSAVLNVTVQFAATGGAVAGGSANLSGGPQGAIAASGVVVASGSGTLSVTVALTAAGFAQAMGAGVLTVVMSTRTMAARHGGLLSADSFSRPQSLSTGRRSWR